MSFALQAEPNISAEAAGRILGVSARHVRQIAEERGWRTDWETVQGGKQKVFALEDVVSEPPEKGTGQVFSEAEKADQSLFSEPVIRKMQILAPILSAEAGRRSQAVSEAAKGFGISERTIRRWLSAVRSEKGTGQVLGDRRTGNQNARKYDTEKIITAIFTLNANLLSPTISQAYKGYKQLRTAEPARQLPEMPYGTFKHYVAQFAPAMLARGRGGNPARNVRKNFVPSILRDWTNMRVMGCWMGDGTAWDQLVSHPDYKNPIRPWLLVWIDVRSRLIVGWRLVDKVNGDTAMLVLHDAWARYGLCLTLYVDNGKEYRNRSSEGHTLYSGKIEIAHISGYLSRIGVQVRNAWVRNPESKAQVERWFSTLSGSYLSLFDAYTGGNITSITRKKDNDRLKRDLDAGRVPTFEEAKALAAAIINAYNTAPHSSLGGKSPMQAFGELYEKTADGAAYAPVVRPTPRILDFALMKRQVVKKITSNGIDFYKHTYGSHQDDFLWAVGLPGYVAYDPEDVRVLHLYAFENGREHYVCDLTEMNGVDVTDERAMKDEIARKRHQEKLIGEAARAMIDRTIDVKRHLRNGVLAADEELLAVHESRFGGASSSPAVLRFPAGGLGGTPKDDTPKLKGLFGAL